MPEVVRINCHATPELRRRLKIECIKRGKSISQVLIKLIEDWLEEKTNDGSNLETRSKNRADGKKQVT